MEVGDLDLRVGRIPRQGGRGRECELFGTGEDPQVGGVHSEDVRLFIAVQFRERVRFVQIGLQARTAVPPSRRRGRLSSSATWDAHPTARKTVTTMTRTRELELRAAWHAR